MHSRPPKGDVFLIVNPAAANGRAKKRAEKAIAALARSGVRARRIDTTGPGHATHIARSLDSTGGAVIALGGDGTVNEVLNGLIGSDARMGVIPLGTGNDFSRLLGLRSTRAAVEAIAEGATQSLDVARIMITNDDGSTVDRHFINTMGIGFDAAVAVRVRAVRFGTGIVPYLIAVAQTLRAFRPSHARITADGAENALDLYLATIGNGTTSGGGFMLSPLADPSDGLLDLCAVRALSIPRVLTVLPKTFSGRHLGAKEVTYTRASGFRLDLDAPLAVHADGEILSTQARFIEVAIDPVPLAVLAPPTAPRT